jgi:hypothetical protein
MRLSRANPLRVVCLLAASLFMVSAAPTAVTVRDIDGRPQTLLAPAGSQLDVVFFIATDCPISNRYAPEIQRICNDYRARGVHCWTVYPDAPDAKTIAQHRHDFGFGDAVPAVIDRDRALVRLVGPTVTPEAAIYSSAGRVYRGRIDDLYVDVGRSRRAATRHDLRAALDATLAGQPVAAAQTEAVGCFISTQ